MNRLSHIILGVATFLISFHLYGQSYENCFLEDFKLKKAEIPEYVDAVKPTSNPSVIVSIKNDTLGEVSKYVLGNAIAAWAGAHNDPTLVENTRLLAPTLIRFPGGSWSDGYFWNGVPLDVPDSVYDGTTYNGTTAQKSKFWGQTGSGGWQTTPDQYYTLRTNSDVEEGLITINYGYARYGTSEDPVAKAAHLAADWVRYDGGRTRFWEIGNENGGPWEYGWMIDTSLNQDGQPQIITGELYGKHFKVFVDSMKAAADETGYPIYVGGQVIHFDATNSWNVPDRKWNEGFFKEVGDKADFYVMHNYFSTSTKVRDILNLAVTEPKNNADFIRNDIINKGAYPKPIALTEYNMGDGSLTRATSYINGMQAVLLMCELIENNFGLGARWLLVSGEATIFYGGDDASIPDYCPRPEFYYLHYLPQFIGDHALKTSSNNTNIVAYSSTFKLGELSAVIINIGTSDQIVKINISNKTVGEKYYTYTFTGGDDNGDFSQYVYINDEEPSENHFGPYEELDYLKARAYPIEDAIKIESPGRSVTMMMIEDGDNVLAINDESTSNLIKEFELFQNYPNPFNPSTYISYQLPTGIFVTIKVYDVLGKEVKTLVNEHQNVGRYSMEFNASKLPSGVYFCTINAGKYSATKKLLLIK